jgi:rubrerythrin
MKKKRIVKKKRNRSYKEIMMEARKRDLKNCPCKHKVYICSKCGKIHGSEVDKKKKGLIADPEYDF